jgi:electron transfer flavoprotein alpha subunit
MSGGTEKRQVAGGKAVFTQVGEQASHAVGSCGDEGTGAGILAVLEPPGPRDEQRGGRDGRDGSGATAAVGAVLVIEGERLARELGTAARAVTWRASGENDLGLVAEALAGFVERVQPRAVLLPDSDVGRQLGPMVAYALDSAAILGCTDVRAAGGVLTFVKPVFGGWLERDIEAADGVIPIATLDLSGFEEPESPPDRFPTPEILEIATATSGRVRRLETIAPDARSVDLVHASRIVAAGAGSATADLMDSVNELADLLEGSVGTTRPVVDDGRLPKERLIGQTGRSVSPELYLALGISGSPHHMAGVKKADRVLSVNRDARAPIFQFSDVGYVADLELVLPGLVKRIKEWRDASGSPE